MNCKDTHKLIHSYLDGDLDGAARSALDGHVATCAACAKEVAAYREIDGMLGVLERAEAPASLSDGVIARLRAGGRIRTEPVRARGGILAKIPGRWRIPAAAVAVVFIAAIVFPSTISTLTGLAGKSAVVASDTYIGVQETASKASVLRSVVDGLATTAMMFKAIAAAFVSVLGTLANVFKFPVVAMVLFLSLGAAVYVRVYLKRGASHASLSI